MKKIDSYRNTYTFHEFVRTGISYVFTKIFWPNARLVRYPICVRGKKNMTYGENFNVGFNCRFDLLTDGEPSLLIGKNFDMGDYCHVSALGKVEIGNNFLCGNSVYIGDISHGLYRKEEGEVQSSPDSVPKDRPIYVDKIRIGNNVWIGEHSVILPGSIIGNGCIIGANSVVNREIPDNCIAAGNPAKIIKRWNDDTKSWEREKV